MTTYKLLVTSGPEQGTSLEIDEAITVGREDCGLLLTEAMVSRTHAQLEPTPDGLRVTDLGSSNGTFVNRTRITEAPMLAHDGDLVSFGDVATVMVTVVAETAADEEPASVAPLLPSFGGSEFATITKDLIEVRYIERSAGKKAAKSMLDSARRARKRLEGFGTESNGEVLRINLIDPVNHGNILVTTGSIVDPDSGQIWSIVSAESPPEDPTRAMALIFGAELADVDEVEHLVAGYGLHLAGYNTAEPRPIAELEDPQRSQVSAAFVKHLIAEGDDAAFRRVLAAPDGTRAAQWQEEYGHSHDELVSAWLHPEEPSHKPGEFIKLAFRYLMPYKVKQAEVFVYMLMSLAFTSVYPFVTRRLFDDVIPSGELSKVVNLLGALLIAFAVSLLAGLRRAYQSAFISGAVVRDIRAEMFGRVQRLRSSELSSYPQGDILARMFGDVGRLEGGLSAMINTGIFEFVSLIVAGVIMLTVNPFLAIVVIIGAPIVGFVYRKMGAGAQERSVKLQEDHATLMTVAAENYRAGPVVRMFQLEGHEESRFGKAANTLLDSSRRMALFSGLFGLSVNMIVTIMQVTILGLGTWLIFEGRFTVGGLVAFLGVMGEFISPVTALTSLGQTMQTSMGSLGRIEDITMAEIEPAGEDLPALTAPKESITLQGLSFSYGPERRTLDELDVTIKAGARTAFVGPSGSGKSTVLQLLMRMFEPDDGAILIDGRDIREHSLSSLRSQMGVVFQDPFLFDISLAQNIALGAVDATPEQVAVAADAAEISAFVDRLPDGLDSAVGEAGSQLSGGQRQRVSIARALVADPSILILDEATSALDAATERQINDTIDRAASGRTVISVTHRLTSITDYDHIVVLVDGRVDEQGTHDDLVAQGGSYARLWSEQTGAPMPEQPAFDAAGALGQASLFRDLDDAGLDDIVAAMQERHVESGTVVTQSAGELVLVTSGSGTFVSAGASDDTETSQVVGAGDYFGVNSLLGAGGEARLHAHEPMSLLVLDAEAYRMLTDRYPQISAGATNSRSTVVLPATSRALGRATISSTGTLDLSAANSRATMGQRMTPSTMADDPLGAARSTVTVDPRATIS